MDVAARAVIAGLMVASTTAPLRAADDVESFYQGKTVSIYAAGSIGGPVEIRSRALMPYLKKYMPGSPNFIVQALPGAGGTRAANQLFNVLPKDGTALGYLQSTIAFNQMVTPHGIQYDANRFAYIGSLDPSGQTIMVMQRSPVKSIADAKKTQVALGSSGVGSSSWIIPAMTNKYLGTRFRIISGFTGVSDIVLAMERGEVDGVTTNLHSVLLTRPHWQVGQEIFAIAQTGLKRDPDVSGAPTLIELAETTGERQVAEFYALASELGVVLTAPPGTPPERTEALRAAMEKAFVDPGFLATAHASGLRVIPRTGAELQDIVKRTLATPPSVVAQMQELLKAK